MNKLLISILLMLFMSCTDDNNDNDKIEEEESIIEEEESIIEKLKLFEVTEEYGNYSGEQLYFDSSGIEIPLKDAILNSDYHDRLYARSGWVVYFDESVFILDSTHVNTSKLTSEFNYLKDKLDSIGSQFSNYELKRASTLCNDPLLCQTFILKFEKFHNVEKVNTFLLEFNSLYFDFKNYPGKFN